jgi:hypothetical protein
LQPAWRLRANRTAEEWGTKISDVARVVEVIEEIERIEGHGQSGRDFIPRLREFEIAEPAEVILRVSGSVQTDCYLRNPGGWKR